MLRCIIAAALICAASFTVPAKAQVGTNFQGTTPQYMAGLKKARAKAYKPKRKYYAKRWKAPRYSYRWKRRAYVAKAKPTNILKAYAVSGGEAGLSTNLRSVIAMLRAKHGRGAVTGVGGRGPRPNVSCHPTGNAFDAHLSSAALRTVKARRDLGVITYSGSMRHVHVSDCARERGYRGHKST